MAVGDRSEKRLVGPVALTATPNTTVGIAVPASRVWVIKQFVICNTSGIDRLLYLAVNTSATVGNRVFSGLPIAGGDTIIWDTALTMTAGEQLYGYSDLASVVSVTAVGWEKEV